MNEESIKKVRKFKPNIIDALLVLAIIAAIAGIAIRSGIAEKVTETVKEYNTPMEKVKISFTVSDINRASFETFTPGDVFRAASMYYEQFGVLETVEMAPAEKYVENVHGQIVKSYSPLTDPDVPDSYARIDVSGTFTSADGKFENGIFKLNGIYDVIPGLEIRIVDKDIDVNIKITNVERITEAE